MDAYESYLARREPPLSIFHPDIPREHHPPVLMRANFLLVSAPSVFHTVTTSASNRVSSSINSSTLSESAP
jgi:hypothetical protein